MLEDDLVEEKLEREDFNDSVPLGGIFLLDEIKEVDQDKKEPKDYEEETEYDLAIPYPLIFVNKTYN